ncbi:MAG: methyltransferase domain-containing protein [Rhodospirillaceae bacterium]|jgi:arsenite methyltransferase|nr:methyltransferase domain-containing protein [Rhodospirillaceae bacterium]MBT7356402.1 methyltransferase domain-containing protein [Rhodospirillaceae bacterium]
MVAILTNERPFIIKAVKEMYTDVASNPGKEFHFPTGRKACEFVGYPASDLDAVPACALESFAGVGYPHAGGFMAEGSIILDVGSGSGTDVLVSSLRVGDEGHVHGLDMTDAMIEKLKANIEIMGANNASSLEGDAENIPLANASVDVVTSNGVLNLVPDKGLAFKEIFRVLRPGGRVQLADIVVGDPISDECKANPELWAECVVGAALEDQYIDLFAAAGFVDIDVLRRFDYFAGSNSEKTRDIATGFKAHTVELTMRKQGNDACTTA